MTRIQHRSALRLLAVVAVALLTVTSAFAPVAAAQEGPPSPPQVYSGTVTDQSGDPVADAHVTVSYDGTVINETDADTNGDYRVEVTQQNGLQEGDTVTIAVKDQTEEMTWEPAGTDQVNFQVEVQQTTTTTPGGGGNDNTGGNNGGNNAGTGGGGGGGGQGGTGPAAGTVSRTAAVSGTNAQVQISGSTGLQGVGFGSQTSLQASVSVQELASSPHPGPEGMTFVTGADIVFESGNPDDVETVRMTVSREKLDSLGVTPEQLTLAHYDSQHASWNQLDTSVASSDDASVTLEAPSDGFSPYVVFASEQAATTTTTTPEPTTTTTTAAPTTTTTTSAPTTTTTSTGGGATGPTGGSGPGPLLIGGIIVVVLALLVAGYLAYNRE